MGSRHSPRPFGSLGWSLAGGLALSLSFPPVGFYPLAWVALVPLLSRWASRRATLALAREIYAVFLVASAATGFWALHLPNELQSALAGLALLLVPLPITAAFWAGAWVRDRFGMRMGLITLAVDVVAAEFLSLHLPFGTPWSLLGHTQALALPFIQAVEIGGVLLLSTWVLGLNIAAFMVFEASRAPLKRQWADRGVAVAAFAGIVVIAALYGTVRTAGDDVPPGHIRIGIVQPDISPEEWEDPMDEERVTHLARASDALLADWAADEASPSRLGYSTMTPRPDLLIWPRNSLPVYGDLERERELYARLETWATRRRTPLLTGARTAADNQGRTERTAQFFPLPMSRSQQSALLFQPSGDGAIRYDQSRRVPILEAVPSSLARSVGDAVPAFQLGSSRTLLPAGRTHLAASLGYESVYGDHTRRFVDDGANLLVAMSPASGGLAGRRQHLAFLRLRALETGRAIVVAAQSGGSTLVLPDGRATQLVSTVPEGARVEAPIYSGKTLYVRYGDWIGQIALMLGLIGHASFWYVNRIRPKKATRRRPMRRMQTTPS